MQLSESELSSKQGRIKQEGLYMDLLLPFSIKYNSTAVAQRILSLREAGSNSIEKKCSQYTDPRKKSLGFKSYRVPCDHIVPYT